MLTAFKQMTLLTMAMVFNRIYVTRPCNSQATLCVLVVILSANSIKATKIRHLRFG